MKHLFSLAIAFCSIVLIASLFSPSIAAGSSGAGQNKTYSFDIAKPELNNIMVSVNLFSPANLPERISLPAPAEKMIQATVNDGSKRKENRTLQALNYKDADPHLTAL